MILDEWGGKPKVARFDPSHGPLAAILSPFSCRFQFPVPVCLNLLLMPASMSFGVMQPMALFRRTLL